MAARVHQLQEEAKFREQVCGWLQGWWPVVGEGTGPFAHLSDDNHPPMITAHPQSPSK